MTYLSLIDKLKIRYVKRFKIKNDYGELKFYTEHVRITIANGIMYMCQRYENEQLKKFVEEMDERKEPITYNGKIIGNVNINGRNPDDAVPLIKNELEIEREEFNEFKKEYDEYIQTIER